MSGGSNSSDVKNSPFLRAHSPQVVRLLHDESGTAKRNPAITGENHQRSAGTVKASTTVQISPDTVLGQCRRNASGKVVLFSPRSCAFHSTLRPIKIPITNRA